MFSLADAQQAEAGPYAADLDGYRRALRSWLAGADLDRWRGLHRSDVPTTMREHAQLVRLLHEQGFGRYGHPAEAGGLGGDVRHSAVLYDELSAHDLPVPEQYVLLCVLGPPLVRFAPAIAAEHLPAFLRGDEWWGQGFSEPEAGSDLASLRTRATKVDGGYVLSGQKLWTSHGSTAARIVVLARTGTPESRHKGLSMLLVDADSPGVTVRPVPLANGRAELAECFFDDVAVPASRLIGTEGQGWAVAMYLLQFERALYAWLRSGHLMQLLRSLADQATSTDEAHRALGECYLDLIALRSGACSRFAASPPARRWAPRPARTRSCSVLPNRACSTRHVTSSDRTSRSAGARTSSGGVTSGGTAARPPSTADPPRCSAASLPIGS